MVEKRSLSLSSEDTKAIHFLKKLKVKQENISRYIKKKHPEIDIETHKINKFLTIFNAIIDSDLDDIKESQIDSEDGFQDIIIIVVMTILELITKNIESLDLPAKIKSGLQKLKKFLSKHGENKTSSTTMVTTTKTRTTKSDEQTLSSSTDSASL